MKQPSLFDDAGNGAVQPALGVPGSRPALGKAQKRFNQLIDKIASQRGLLQRWHDFVPTFQQRHAAEIAPLDERLRNGRIAMVGLLDGVIDHKALSKLQRAKVHDLLLGQLAELLGEAPDADLVRLYDKHSGVSYEDARQEDMAFTQAVAREVFGVDLEDADAAASPDDLARRIAEEMQAAQAQQAERRKSRKQGRKQSPKAAAAEALREQAAQGASRAIREVFRKLASELHPDRETDLQERARKTELMQRANAAYGAGDLLTLLELQLSLEQIDADALADMAQDRLAHYNHVLDEQLQRLQEELSDVTMPFAMMLGGRVGRQLTPEAVLQALDADMRELRATAEALEADLIDLRDINVLKRMLRDYRIGQDEFDDFEMFSEVLLAPAPRRRR
jgi:hypothetical protein